MLQRKPESFRANIYFHIFSFFSSFDATLPLIRLKTNPTGLENLICDALTVME
jgi:hypothetical protein